MEATAWTAVVCSSGTSADNCMAGRAPATQKAITVVISANQHYRFWIRSLRPLNVLGMQGLCKLLVCSTLSESVTLLDL